MTNVQVLKARPARRSRARYAAATVVTLLSLLPAGRAVGDSLQHHLIDPVRAVQLHAQQRWLQVADAFDTAGSNPDPFYAAADAASALASRVAIKGWAAPDTAALVAALIASANPDGGYGLAKPWDAFQDGTVNAASTSYTATTAGHVGPVLLAGYAAGAVPAAAVRHAIDSLLDLPRSHSGTCIPYSNSAFDLNGPCVWNVHFGAADWVLRASRLTGYRTTAAEQLAKVATSWLGVLKQNPATGYWAYSSAGGGPQDIGHQLWTASAVDSLLGNHEAMSMMLARPLWRIQARVFHDSNVASAMSAIAQFDCRYATDPTILRYAQSTQRGAPYALKALATAARVVVSSCFSSDRVSVRGGARSQAPVLVNLG
jgi:hypothetical protein